MRWVEIHTDFIRLDAFLKFAGVSLTGGEAKWAVQEGEVRVNGEVCTQRGKKLVPGDRVQAGGEELLVAREEEQPVFRVKLRRKG